MKTGAPFKFYEKMEVKSVSESSLSNVKLSRSEKKKTKKQRKHRAIENGNAESKEKETSLGTDSNNLLLESKANVTLDSRLQEGENSLREDVHLETEQSSRSHRKRKREEDSSIGEKQSDSFVESSGLKEDANSLMKDSLWERDSNVETPENIGSESGLKESRLNEQPAHSERKRQRKRERKMAKAGQFEKLYAKSVLELSNRKENSLIEEKKQSDSHLESKMSVSLESGLKKRENSDLGTLENISLDSGLKGTRLTEQMVQSESKRKRGKRKKRTLSVLEDKDISSKRNDRVSNEAENHNMCPEPQIINGKDFRKEDLMSENVESKNMKTISLIPDKQSDSPRTASTGMVETQNPHVDGDLVMPEIKVIKTFQIGKTVKTHHRKRKRKKSPNLLGDGLEHVQENGMIQTSVDHLEKEHTTGFSENESDGVLVGHAMPAQVLEEAFGNNTGTESAVKGRKRKKRKKLKESLCKYPDQKDVEIETKTEELVPSLSNLAVAKDDVALTANVKENNLSRTFHSSLERICISRPKKKLLVLDLNGILVDVVQSPGKFQPDITVAGKGVFRRPFCDDFLNFCFRTFNVGIWSSRIYKNVNRLVSFLMRKWRHNLLFCWDRKQCTITKFKTIEDEQKPLVLKELGKLWEKHLPNLPWEKGEYDESNTLLLDDSPYKALRNPANTAIFPYPYQYKDARDSSLARGGDIRKYLERLAAAKNVQKYVEQNPFGQPAITESNPHWDFYCQIIDDKTLQAQ